MRILNLVTPTNNAVFSDTLTNTSQSFAAKRHFNLFNIKGQKGLFFKQLTFTASKQSEILHAETPCSFFINFERLPNILNLTCDYSF